MGRFKRPAQFLALGVLGALAMVGAAPATSNAATDQLYAFGNNSDGQLGSTAIDGPNPTPTLVTVPGSTGSFAELAAGAMHSLVSTSTGQLYAFGFNRYGQLGNTTNSGNPSPNPTPTRVVLPGATGTISGVAAGIDHSLALTTTGQLYAFGLNDYGELGISPNSGTSNPNPTPTRVTLPGATGPVTEVAAGLEHSLALTSTGQLYAFGANQYGQLGKTANNNANPSPTPVTLPGATGTIAKIAAGGNHSLALTSTGQLYAFGFDYYGQLGNGISGDGNPHPTPTQVTLPGATGSVTQIDGGDAHSLALTSSGQLYAFGSNGSGQLGNSTAGNTHSTPIQVTLPGASGTIVKIAAGDLHTLAVTSTNELFAFGGNNAGQLGNPSVTSSWSGIPTPTRVSLSVPAGDGISAIAHGPEAEHTLVGLSPLPASVSGLRVAPRRFSLTGRKVGGRCVKPTRKNRSQKRCTRKLKLTIRYSLASDAAVKFTLKRQAPGRRAKGRCVKPTRKNRQHKHCRRLIRIRGTVTKNGTAGANSFTFHGRVEGHTLKPGTYQLTATTPAGTQSTTFTLTR